MGRSRVLGFLVVTLLSLLVVPVSASSLTVTTTPDELPVLLDGNNQGSSPAKLSLDSAEHVLNVSNGDTVWESPIRLNGKARLTLSLTGTSTQSPHRALVLSRPAGADVLIDGTLRGQTPWSGDLPAEERTVELVKEGYDTWSMTLIPAGDFSVRGTLSRSSGMGEASDTDSSASSSRVQRVMPVEPVESEPEPRDAPSIEQPTDTRMKTKTDTQTDEAKPTDEPETVPLSVTSEPDGARVRVNGESFGRTPVVRKGVRPGTATIALEKEGYRGWTERMYLDDPTRLTVQLQRIKSSLLLEGTPDTMQITVDGTTLKPGSGKRLEVDPGTYTIQARARDHASFDTTLSLEPGATRELRIDLEPVLHVWDYPATRDVFLRLGRNTLGELVDVFGLETGDRVRLVPVRDTPGHALVHDVLSLVMNRKALIVVDEPSSGEPRAGDTTDTAPKPLDGLLKFRVVDMGVNYEPAEDRYGEDFTKRYFTMKLYAKLVKPSGGEVQYSRYFTRTTADSVPTRFRTTLEESYSSAGE